jgi:fructose-bisphosphate aldolase/2-amino-3,7-dideoxy-D-threo-hept-6-ulosonate synthase
MLNVGKQIRLERIIHRGTKRAVLVPIDHGVTVGPIHGIVDVRDTINKIAEGGATGVVLHKGLVASGYRGYGKDIGLIIHISASTALGRNPHAKVLVSSVEEVIKLGGDAVSVHVNIGAETENEMLFDLGTVSEACNNWGMPLLVMAYPRGPKVKNEYDVDVVKHAARVAAELGADIVKTNYTGNEASFREVIRSCPVPVLMAGGPKIDSDKALFTMIRGAMDAGASGVSIGRNIFQHKDVVAITNTISKIVLNDASVEDALKELKERH